ncbi:MAG: aromatic hydrocarbon degradation protein, partial [Phaeodactylibacter sp.]|nr:aromatic hydrocarbon degradation protein [Phaeodactylibacter sp.]
MTNRILSLLILSVLAYAGLHAQSFTDALRYSHFETGGTARSIGVGGALGALGSDFSVLSTNPAGMGWYRSSEFVISPSFFNASTESLLVNDKENTPMEESRTNFNLNSFGVVVASRPRSASWSTFNFGVGLNRLANFNQYYYYRGMSEGSIVDRFLEQANSNEGISDFES